MAEPSQNLKHKQAEARDHEVRARILELFPTERAEAPSASLVVEMLKSDFPDLTPGVANYHLLRLKEADLLPSSRHRTEKDIKLAIGIGAAVRELREHRGIPKGDLAHMADLPDSDLEAIEAGTAEEYWGDLRKLAPALGVALTGLIEMGEELAPPLDSPDNQKGPLPVKEEREAPQPDS